ncbi:MAG TPA: DUF2269 family protein [Dehalococcoidia bacterium]|nr:DUF2269 family protein [Dehalococcoidia bacterium]
MTGTDILRWLHFICLFYMMFGLGAVMVPLWHAWRETDIERQLVAMEDATTGHKAGLLPGTIAVGASGLALAGNIGFNFFTTGWLVALELTYLFVLFFCIPILGHSLNRVQTEVLKSRKKNVQSPELQELLNDNVPIVFALVILFLIPVMVYFAEFQPF